MADTDDRYPTPRGWRGGNKDFTVTRQDRSRLSRISTETRTYNYPGADGDEGPDQGEDD